MEIKWRSNFYKWKEASAEDGFPFTMQEYISFNKGIQFIKYDPKIINANPPLISESFKDVFPTVRYYQFSRVSIYRPFPLRVLYSKELGNFHELKGQSKPIYEVMRYLRYQHVFTSAGKFDQDKAERWARANLTKYLMFYFDNVVGIHGRFEVINRQSLQTSLLDQFVNRINTFYKIQQNPEEQKAAVLGRFKQVYGSLQIPFDEFRLKLKLKEAVKEFMDNSLDDIKSLTNSNFVWELRDIPMVFQAGLFTATARCNLNPGKQFGFVSLQDEVIHRIKLSKNFDDIKVELFPFGGSQRTDDSTDVIDDFPAFD